MKRSGIMQKRIAMINDFCGFGRCSITVALPIISALKVQCCPLPTSVFSNHTGFDSFYKADFTDHLDSFIDQWDRLQLSFDGILSGYLGSEKQIESVLRFADRFKTTDTLMIVDPIMGDNGRLYASYSPALAKKMGMLAYGADILTPNLTEACILTDTPYKDNISRGELEEICRKLSALGPKRIVISGIDRGEELENFVCCGSSFDSLRVKKVGPGRPGTGDIFSSIIAADAVKGVDFAESVNHAAKFIAKVLAYTCEQDVPKPYGVCFEEFLTEL
ncbi:MAG: pyridoxamine kinase [Clostridia bacterium]|nr:pyridoxamine kinase [Clostridia bacterium]